MLRRALAHYHLYCRVAVLRKGLHLVPFTDLLDEILTSFDLPLLPRRSGLRCDRQEGLQVKAHLLAQLRLTLRAPLQKLLVKLQEVILFWVEKLAKLTIATSLLPFPRRDAVHWPRIRWPAWR